LLLRKWKIPTELLEWCGQVTQVESRSICYSHWRKISSIEKTDHFGDVHDAPELYIAGILWNMQKYLSGICPNYEFRVPRVADYKSILALYQRNLQEGKSNVLYSGTTYIEHPLNAHAFSLGRLPRACWVFFDQEGPIEI
jgi:hypothetical protein